MANRRRPDPLARRQHRSHSRAAAVASSWRLRLVELAVDDVSGTLVSRPSPHSVPDMPRSTGPSRAAVTEGAARILLNSAPQRSIGAATAAIAALGVESSTGLSTQRAERLLAPELPRARRPDEAELSSVAAPDGQQCSSAAPDRAPTGSTTSLPPTPRRPPSRCLSDIDRVSLTESIDDFDQTALFYRSVLNLRPGRTTESTAPFGLVRSWSASDPAQQVRITLNTAPLRHGDWAPMVSNPQHVAFTTDDAIGCARILRELGAPLLAIPSNYYDDLDARLTLPSELLAAMRDTRSSTTVTSVVSTCTSSPRSVAPACSSRWFSASVGTPARRSKRHANAHGRAPAPALADAD